MKILCFLILCFCFESTLAQQNIFEYCKENQYKEITIENIDQIIRKSYSKFYDQNNLLEDTIINSNGIDYKLKLDVVAIKKYKNGEVNITVQSTGKPEPNILTTKFDELGNVTFEKTSYIPKDINNGSYFEYDDKNRITKIYTESSTGEVLNLQTTFLENGMIDSLYLFTILGSVWIKRDPENVRKYELHPVMDPEYIEMMKAMGEEPPTLPKEHLIVNLNESSCQCHQAKYYKENETTGELNLLGEYYVNMDFMLIEEIVYDSNKTKTTHKKYEYNTKNQRTSDFNVLTEINLKNEFDKHGNIIKEYKDGLIYLHKYNEQNNVTESITITNKNEILNFTSYFYQYK